MSANKASKQYGIPSSVSNMHVVQSVKLGFHNFSMYLQTLYKMARREKIELAQPFNAIHTSWTSERLEKALQSIRGGVPVMKAAMEFEIPTGTL